MTVSLEKVNNLNVLEEELKKLLNTPIDSVEDLENWLLTQTELYDKVEESTLGHYIDFQCYSNDEEKKKAVEHDQEKVKPLMKRYKFKLDEKFMQTTFRHQLNQTYYSRFIKSKELAMKLYSEKNIEIEVKEDHLVNKYFELMGGLSYSLEGKELTFSELRQVFKSPDRDKRQQAMILMYDKFESLADDLQPILTELIQLRDEKAKNVGFANFRDYMFAKYERFDYGPEDCKQLADAVAKHAVPLNRHIQQQHKYELGLEDYYPWDQHAEASGLEPLKPYEEMDTFLERTSEILNKLDPEFSTLLKEMDEQGKLDLESRKGKAQGGFCEYLPVSRMSFIFMNAAKAHSDLITLVHEMGHCIHDRMKRDIRLGKYREIPMESAELASMSMELFTLRDWKAYYPNQEDFIRAQKKQWENVIGMLQSVMVIDQFQHWLYENPNHTVEQRQERYVEISNEFSSGVVNWNGRERWKELNWFIVLHIFEVPFYFIEYAIAQLGAVQLYMQFKQNPDRTLANYKQALSLGSSKSLPEVYEAAGIRFDFSEEMVKKLMDFAHNELQQLKN